MDKSFNDQELSEIMKEIEALEDEFTADLSKAQMTPKEVATSEVIEKLGQMETSSSVLPTNLSEPILSPEAIISMEKKSSEAFESKESELVHEEEAALEAETDVESELDSILESELDAELEAATQSAPAPAPTPTNLRILQPSSSTSTSAATSKSSNPNSSMSFKVQGEMKIDLQFDIGGKSISLFVSEAGLNIEMDGGVTFTVPVSNAQKGKKAV